MKIFLKNALSTTLGIFIFLGLTVVLIIIILLSINTWKKKSSTPINNNSILEIHLNNKIIENPNEIESNLLNFNNSSIISLQEQIASIITAKNDNRIKGISLIIDNIDIGITQIKEFHNALIEFKKSGKFIYTYLCHTVNQKAYYLASISDKIFLNPNSTIEFFGLSSEILFFKNFFNKYGIKCNIIRYGKYKSAVEPLIRNSISKENKLQINENLSDLWKNISQDISKYRKIPIKLLNKIVSNLQSIIPILSIKYKLVDQLIYEADYTTILKNKLKISEFKKLNTISLINYYQEKLNKIKEINKIAILYFSGIISDGENSSNIQSEFYKKIIRKIKNNNSIKALVIRINSPGGDANASDEILYELKLLRKKKPIIVSFGDIAASGGYYIAMQSDSIFAHPTTITGSIGVLGIIPDIKKIINNIGIRSDIIQTHPNSYFYSPTYGLSKGAEKILKKSIKILYNRFVNLVANNRKKTFKQINDIAQGRIWSGNQALKNGLIDKFGGLDYAIKSAAKIAKINIFSIENYPKKENTLNFLINTFNKKSLLEKTLKYCISEKDYFFLQKIIKMKNHINIMLISPIDIKF